MEPTLGHRMSIPPHVPDQAPFQALSYILGSPTDQVSPSTGPTVGDDANDGNVGHFVDDAVRDDDSP